VHIKHEMRGAGSLPEGSRFSTSPMNPIHDCKKNRECGCLFISSPLLSLVLTSVPCAVAAGLAASDGVGFGSSVLLVSRCGGCGCAHKPTPWVGGAAQSATGAAFPCDVGYIQTSHSPQQHACLNCTCIERLLMMRVLGGDGWRLSDAFLLRLRNLWVTGTAARPSYTYMVLLALGSAYRQLLPATVTFLMHAPGRSGGGWPDAQLTRRLCVSPVSVSHLQLGTDHKCAQYCVAFRTYNLN